VEQTTSIAMAALPPAPRIGHNPTVDTMAGAAGGFVSVLLGEVLAFSSPLISLTLRKGQPFDLIKVRMQTQRSSHVFRVISDILKNEGPLSFYRVNFESTFHREP
jgi:hypothetical protein